ncbi:MAG: DUF6338 family protein [Pseudomonas sp.]|uniref:DUF6338 family protein n=1 Tax=Pseudomonas sp. TaxID=306 RepID=UPI003D0E5727
MPEISTQLYTLLQALLPGFVTSLIFYWLASAPKPGQFERIIQALIGSLIISYVVEAFKIACLWVGKSHSLGMWSPGVENLWSLAIATAFGLLLARCAHTNYFYRIAAKHGLTTRSSNLILEWEFAFSRYRDRYVVLNLLDGRRLMGYLRAWPSDPGNGHFLVADPHWLDGETMTRYEGTSAILIANCDVQWVDFLDGQEDTDEL